MAKRSSLIRIVALVTLASGVADLYSVTSPLSPARLRLLHEILPLEFFHFPHSFILLIGLAIRRRLVAGRRRIDLGVA